MLIDSDVFIWYFRGNDKAAKAIENTNNLQISSVVYMELLQGMRNKKELNAFKKFIQLHNIRCIPLTPEITARAIHFIELYSLSHGLRMADALIAATCDIHGDTLMTANDVHYKMITSLTIQIFRPH
ncbi:MAG: type II toxin-antitoxin system VapC family toxin [Pseudomonadota bacterium]